MSSVACASDVTFCIEDKRRRAVRLSGTLCGIDYVEVERDGLTLCVRLFGHVPENLSVRNVVIEGGDRIRDIQVVSATLREDADGDVFLHVKLDRSGDCSKYCLCLIEPEERNVRCGHDTAPRAPLVRAVPRGVDPRYACAMFGFRLDCPSELDCKPVSCASPTKFPAPAIDYLTRDFTGFRRLMLDRLAVTMPQWRERHIADIGVTLVELLAYRADELSYQLDAVATEAYLATARRRISIRRHARLLDYRLHEGCNARAWIALESDMDVEFELQDLVFAAPPPGGAALSDGIVPWEQLRQIRDVTLFEPMMLEGIYVMKDGVPTVRVLTAHSVIHFYTWRMESCCLPAGSTRATLIDQAKERRRILNLAPGSLLILEEIVGAVTGTRADRDLRKRHIVRLARVEERVDPLDGTLLLEVQWHDCDALPFALCLSARTASPTCVHVEVAVARGNVVIVDHGETIVEESDSWIVGVASQSGCCQCDGTVADVVQTAKTLSFALGRRNVTHSVVPVQIQCPTSELLEQDPRQATASVWLDVASADELSEQRGEWAGTYEWSARWDLLASTAYDRHFVPEVDDGGSVQIRFGDDDCGLRPRAGWRFRARYRVGNGPDGNVGVEAITWVSRRSGPMDGVRLIVRNPMPARGGQSPEPVADARMYAPHAYGRKLERAVSARDYAQIAGESRHIDGAHAALAWTGSWYEARVALDQFAKFTADSAEDVLSRLQQVRRVGHDLRIVPAIAVPLRIRLLVCVANGYARADVTSAVLDALSNRDLGNGRLGFFHPDRLEFGADIAASQVISVVQALPGVAHVEIKEFTRLDASTAKAERARIDGFIAIHTSEIAQLENDPDFPEHGTVVLDVQGGR
jgi:hypothetical protein